MAGSYDRQLEREADTFRPDRRPFLFAVAANVLLAFLFLVLPYSRARMRANDAREAFSAYAACFLHGVPVDDPGLALPAGEREHYAHLVLHGEPDWPSRCDEFLTDIAPTEATFLFPSVKQANADMRASLDLLRTELKALRPESRALLDHVPGRPMLALSRVRSALALLMDAAGDPDSIDRDAITLPPLDDAVLPARVPISAAQNASLYLHTEASRLEAYALDVRGLSWIQVDNGAIDRHRPKRPRLLRALTFLPEPYLVWAHSQDRCSKLDNGCVHRAMGVAPLAPVGPRLREPQWLAGHPVGRPDRHVQRAGELLWVLALDDAPATMDLRSFKLGEATPDKGDPTSASRHLSLGSSSIHDGLLLAGDPLRLVTATGSEAESTFSVHTITTVADPVAEHTLPGGQPFSIACTGGATLWLALFTRDASMLARMTSDNGNASVSLAAGSERPFHNDDPARDRIHVVCDDTHAAVLRLDDTRNELTAQICDDELRCTETRTLTKRTAAFSALMRDDDLIVAVTSDDDSGQIRVRRFDRTLSPLGDEVVPAACWFPTEGLCGIPTLAQDADRIVLAAHEQSDLLVVESRDQAEHWQPLAGLRVHDPLAPDHTILDIHRERKRYRK